MTLRKSSGKVNEKTYLENRGRVLAHLPATCYELQEKLQLSNKRLRYHLQILKDEGLIYISAYRAAANMTSHSGGQLANVYSICNKNSNNLDAQRPKKKREVRAERKMIQSKPIVVVHKMPKLDPLAVMYARNETQDIRSITGN